MWPPLTRRGDRSIARGLLSLQFSYTDAAGRAYSRHDFLAGLKSLSAVTAGDPKLTMYGLLATVTGERKAGDGGTAFFLDIWVKQKGAWRALARHDVVIADGGALASPTSRGDVKAVDCSNPCQTMPYRVRSPAEQDVLNSFLAIEKASIAHDALEWSKHVTDDVLLYRSGYAPVDKAARIATIERQTSRKFGDGRRNPGVAVVGVRRCRGDDHDANGSRQFPSALSRGPRLDPAQWPMAAGGERADRYPDAIAQRRL